MSKFEIKFIERRQAWALRCDGMFLTDLSTEDLADLATATQAALAGQNSRVMSGCKCKGRKSLVGICDSFMPIHGDPAKHCARCAHDGPCHSTHNTENQGE